MSNSPFIYLDLKLGGGPAGWTNVQASNGQSYGYRFTGGTDGLGNVEQAIGEQKEISAVSIADPRFQFIGDCITISNDPNNELSGRVNDVRSITVTNKNDKAESNAYWSVAITDTQLNCTIPCDPKVTNDPN